MATPVGDRLYQVHQGDRPVPTLAVAPEPQQAVNGVDVAYGEMDGMPIIGYLARPADTRRTYPGLIVIHEWWGLNDNIQQMTERLAGEGYVALAVDLFGSTADTPEAARSQVMAASEHPERLEDNLRQAFHYLQTEQNAPRIASIGWCFGGSWSLRTALLLPDELDAAVIYYGGQLETDPEVLAPLTMPILGIFGELDTNPPVETVQAFEAALNQLGKEVEIHIYENADHAFANSSGTRYNPEAAEAAWEQTTAFLERHLHMPLMSTEDDAEL
jgi:carboxymethylenebutenolidase